MAISQKLHTKLVQKLILTPSLQQAIKLLPMSTLELADLLNQEMVENPLLEEVPTEELQPAEQQQPEKQEAQPAVEKPDTWDDADYDYFFGDYLDDGYRSRTPSEVKELPPIENTLSLGGLALRSSALAAGDADGRRGRQGDRRRHRRQPRRRRLSGGLGRGDRGDGRVAGRGGREGPAARADLRPDRRRRARSSGVPLAADPAPRARGDAVREDRHRAPPAAAEPPGAGDRPQAGHADRRAEGTHRDHP